MIAYFDDRQRELAKREGLKVKPLDAQREINSK
jgi:hypothetical protein